MSFMADTTLTPLALTPALLEDIGELDEHATSLQAEVSVHYLMFEDMADGSERLYVCEGSTNPCRAV